MYSHLDQQLTAIVKLLNGDSKAAKRLVSSAIDRYPGHSAKWYLEKVLYDLERDRHAI